MVSGTRRKAVLPEIRKGWQLSERRACAILTVNRRAVRYRPMRASIDAALRLRIRSWLPPGSDTANAASTCCCGEGWHVNIERVARIYRAEGLSIRTKTPRRRRAAVVREQPPLLTAPNQSWAMDFMHDVLADGSKIRLLTIVDMFSRESIALEVDYGFKSPQVVEILQRAVAQRGAPERIHCDNGPEFVSLNLDQWAYWSRVKLAFSRPGRPSDNAFCESFNNRVRQELLNPHWFTSLEDARLRAAEWRIDYNTIHPHSSLGVSHPKSSPGVPRITCTKPPFRGLPRDKNWA
jgi:putative transposase